jgi:hypothetical protein
MFGLYQKQNVGKIGETNTSLFPLKRGSKNPYVWALQRMLNEKFAAGIVIDGAFGAGTENACKKYLGVTSVTNVKFVDVMLLLMPVSMFDGKGVDERAKICIESLENAQLNFVRSAVMFQGKFASIMQEQQSLLKEIANKAILLLYKENFSSNWKITYQNPVFVENVKIASSYYGSIFTDVLVWSKMPTYTKKGSYTLKPMENAQQAFRIAYFADCVGAYADKYFSPQSSSDNTPSGGNSNVMPWGNSDTVAPPSNANDNVPTGGNKRDLGETIDNLIYIGTIGGFVAIGAKVIGIISGTVASAGRQLKS